MNEKLLARGTKSSYRVIILDKRIINETAIVLLGYIVLTILLLQPYRNSLQVWLAIVLSMFGSGFSTVTVLFPRSNDLDIVERAALSASLSLAIGGILAFALARSPWGLHLWPYLSLTVVYNFVCYFLTWYRRRKFGEDERIFRLDIRELYFWRKTDQTLASRIITTVLVVFFFTGAWVLNQNLHSPPINPSMTEFYILGQNGKTEEYPKTGQPGKTLNITYGITNHETSAASYQVKAYIDAQAVGNSQLVNLDVNETQMSQIKFQLLDTVSGTTKVEFVLYRDEKPYRSLYLWITIVNP